jgi:hypothetical protein
VTRLFQKIALDSAKLPGQPGLDQGLDHQLYNTLINVKAPDKLHAERPSNRDILTGPSMLEIKACPIMGEMAMSDQTAFRMPVPL